MELVSSFKIVLIDKFDFETPSIEAKLTPYLCARNISLLALALVLSERIKNIGVR